MNSISQRDAFWNKVYEMAKEDRNVVVITADMGAPSLDKFKKDLSSQFVNVGIAEQNAINLAAGLSLTGKKVFTYAIAPFITLRCLEQIRVQNAIMEIPITIVGVGAGFGYPDSGPTHHILEDIAILRAMPNIIINNITDSIMASAFGEISYNAKKTNYIRLDRQLIPDIYTRKHDFTKGLAILKEGKDFYLIATGSMTHTALSIADKLAAKKIQVGVIDVYTFPIKEELFLNTIKGAKKLISLEEHFLPGGLGSSVCEILNDHKILIPVKRIGLPTDKGYEYCYKYGGREVIREYYGIDDMSIERKVMEFLK